VLPPRPLGGGGGGGAPDGDALLLDGVLALLKKFNTNFLIN
jgi:hypothetical protein